MNAAKRLTALVIILCILLCVLPATASAAAGGTCGPSLSWSVSGNTLTITGSGKMDDYEWGDAPWFEHISSIEKVVIGSGVTYIGSAAFIECVLLKSVSLPNTINQIGPAAFAYCVSLTGITLPSGLEVISDSAFTASGLKEVSIHSNVTQIGDMAFEGCMFLEKFTVSRENNFFSTDGFGVLFNKNKTELIQAPAALTGSYTVPATVKKIGPMAFEMTSFTNVMIPGSVEFIGEGAFRYSDTLSSVTMANGVAYIQSDAFRNCTKLKTVKLPDSVAYIGKNAFAGSGIENISLPDRETHIDDYAFYGCESLKNVTVPEGIVSLGDGVFQYCTGLKTVAIGGSAETIGAFAFYGCENLTTVKLGEGITLIGTGAFFECGKLSSIAIPRTLSAVENDAFYNCNALVTVFYTGRYTNKDGIANYGGNDTFFFNAAWHYQSIELSGKYPAYYCGACEMCFFPDNTQSHFTDVLTNNWQFVHAKYAVDHNLMAGTGTDAYGRTTFLPDNAITREEFVQVLYNASGKPAVTIENKFPDVSDTGWYKNAVLWANENNIANGLGDGSFGVGRKITRQDLALMLYKYAVLQGCTLDATTGVTLQYGDGATISGYAQKAMDWAVTNGILSGKGTAGKPLSTFRLDPAGTATRAECAAMLRNFMTAFGL